MKCEIVLGLNVQASDLRQAQKGDVSVVWIRSEPEDKSVDSKMYQRNRPRQEGVERRKCRLDEDLAFATCISTNSDTVRESS